MKTSGKALAEKVKQIKESDMLSIRSDSLPTWCPGCGYFGIQQALNNAIQQLGLAHHEIVNVTGIGCAGRYAFFNDAYGLHVVHGRLLPVSTGIKMANPELTVFAVGGDGDGLAIGAGHLPHMVRRNVNVNYLLFDNSTFGLTKGQISPTSPIGTVSKASPSGNVDTPLNATLMALSYGPTFVARLYAGDPKYNTPILKEGIQHNGFSLFHFYSSCVTFDKVYKTWGNLKDQIHPLPPTYDSSNLKQAIAHVLEDDFSMGIIYKSV